MQVSSQRAHLVVIGGASLDVLHFAGRSVRSAGGAGLYTALAARRAGASVTMVGPRPSPVPPELAVAAERLDWRGPTVPAEQLPTFEVAHARNGTSEMLRADWRAESDLGPATLPQDLPEGAVYCIPLADPERQLELVRHFKSRGRWTACGTFACAVSEQRDVVAEALATADVFFCNEIEAKGLFGSLRDARAEPGKLLFITRGSRGARVMQGDHATDMAAVAVEELDPTGAGDTFCGTVLALLVGGEHPVTAARQAVAAAAETVTRIGPEALLEPPAAHRIGDSRVRVDSERIEAVGEVLRNLEDFEPFEFVGEFFPAPGHPLALDFFFAATLQQFGFWTAAGERYHEPMIATFEGRPLKGSDFLWAAYRRWLEEDPAGLRAAALAEIEPAVVDLRFCADDGHNPLPATELRLRRARAYGRDLVALGWTPATVVERAGRSRWPLATFLSLMDRIGGYKEDPLRKKSALLAAILQARPERFLRLGEGEALPPIVDYHLQRSCLRIGCIRVEDDELRRRLEERRVVDEESEWAVRQAAFDALRAVQEASGRSMAALDWFFFQNRRRCPEMSEPDCAACPLDPVCAHRKRLFQPVFRTTFY